MSLYAMLEVLCLFSYLVLHNKETENEQFTILKEDM